METMTMLGRSDALDVDWQHPIPHPADFDWRFNRSTAEFLFHTVCAPLRVGRRSLLIGAPSVFRIATKMGFHSPKVTLWDRNAEDFGAGAAIDAMSGQFPSINNVQAFDAVLVDPPWYSGDVRSFLWVAATAATNGAPVYCGWPGVGTRPGIDDEWIALTEWVQSVSLQLVAVMPKALTYLTPPFERNSLLAAGIGHVPAEWRLGDLIEFRRISKPAIPKPRAVTPPDCWHEVCWDRVRWKIRDAQNFPSADPRLEPLVAGDILPSVSR